MTPPNRLAEMSRLAAIEQELRGLTVIDVSLYRDEDGTIGVHEIILQDKNRRTLVIAPETPRSMHFRLYPRGGVTPATSQHWERDYP